VERAGTGRQHSPHTPSSQAQMIPDAPSNHVPVVTPSVPPRRTSDLSKAGNSVQISDIPGGDKLSDLDTEGHSAQLLQWPDTISVVSHGARPPSIPVPSPYPALSIPVGTSKPGLAVTSHHTAHGSGKV